MSGDMFSNRGALRNQRGMTLIEILTALAIMGIILVPLLAWTALTMSETPKIANRAEQAKSFALLNMYFQRDITSSEYAVGNDIPGSDCGAGPGQTAGRPPLTVNIPTLPENPAGADRLTMVTYTIVQKPGSTTKWQMYRRTCTPTTRTVTNEILVADDLPAGALSVDCYPLDPALTDCYDNNGLDRVPGRWEMTLEGAAGAQVIASAAQLDSKEAFPAYFHLRAVQSPDLSLGKAEISVTYVDSAGAALPTISSFAWRLDAGLGRHLDDTAHIDYLAANPTVQACRSGGPSVNEGTAAAPVILDSMPCPANVTDTIYVDPPLGEAEATLVALTDDGREISGTVRWDLANLPPVANFTTNQSPAVTPLAMTLNARDTTTNTFKVDGNGSFDYDGSISSLRWEIREASDTSTPMPLTCHTGAGSPPAPSPGFPVCSTAAAPNLAMFVRGTYEVTLEVTDNRGAISAPVSKDIVVNGYLPPIAAVGPNLSTTINAPLMLDGFPSVAASTAAGTDPITDIRWLEGSVDKIQSYPNLGQTSSQRYTPYFSWPTVGIKTVTLGVKSGSGPWTNLQVNISVGNQQPVADANVRPHTEPNGVRYSKFFAGPFPPSPSTTGSKDPDVGDSIATVTWDFGDGSPLVTGNFTNAAVRDPIHRFVNPPPNGANYYTVKLTVTDTSYGMAGTDTLKMTVPSITNFTASPSTGIAPDYSTIGAQGTADPARPDAVVEKYTWNYGDGSPQLDGMTHQNISHLYQNPCRCDIVVSVEDNYGLTGRAFKSVDFVKLETPRSFRISNGNGAWFGNAGWLEFQFTAPPGATSANTVYEISVWGTKNGIGGFTCQVFTINKTLRFTHQGGAGTSQTIRTNSPATLTNWNSAICGFASYNARVETIFTNSQGQEVRSGLTSTASRWLGAPW